MIIHKISIEDPDEEESNDEIEEIEQVAPILMILKKAIRELIKVLAHRQMLNFIEADSSNQNLKNHKNQKRNKNR